MKKSVFIAITASPSILFNKLQGLIQQWLCFLPNPKRVKLLSEWKEEFHNELGEAVYSVNVYAV